MSEKITVFGEVVKGLTGIADEARQQIMGRDKPGHKSSGGSSGGSRVVYHVHLYPPNKKPRP